MASAPACQALLVLTIVCESMSRRTMRFKMQPAIGFHGLPVFLPSPRSQEGAALAETKMGALLSFGAAPLALVMSRLLSVRARLPD